MSKLPALFPKIGCLALLGCLSVAPGRSNESTWEPALLPTFPPCPIPLAGLVSYAAIHHLDIDQIDPPRDGQSEVGDRVVALVTLFDGPSEKQWLVEMDVAEANDQERKNGAVPDLVIYTSTGNQLRFKSSLVPLQLRTHGPFLAAKASREPGSPKTARVSISSDFLSLGFDQACRANLRIGEIARKNSGKKHFGFSFADKPFPDATIKSGKLSAQKYLLSTEEERAFAGTLPSLITFFDLTLHTPGLQEILAEVVDIPFWSILSHGGKIEPNFNFESDGVKALAYGLQHDPHYSLPVMLTLNGKPALHINFLVTTPRPPFLTSAGILAVFAEHPTRKDRQLYFEIVSARRSATTALAPNSVAAAVPHNP